MRSVFICLFILFYAQHNFAQVTVAENWTKTDCDGTEHILFDELDAGNVVMMELIMLDGCIPCITAANLMAPIVAQYNAAYENRIQWYTMGFNDSYSCSAFTDWKAENAVPCDAQFTEGADQIDYYGGMGMPTIVVVGRNTHTVYYNKFGFTVFDTINFANALEYALGIEEPLSVPGISETRTKIYPNPTSSYLSIQNIPVSTIAIEIYDMFGKLQSMESPNQTRIDIQLLPAGIYTLRIQSDIGFQSLRFVKN